MTSKGRTLLVSALSIMVLSWSSPALADGEILIAEEEYASTSDKAIGMSFVGGFFAAGYIWAYFAWYRGRSLTDEIIWNDEGGFGLDTYAGGADKFGHMFSNYAIARGTTQILTGWGWDSWVASTVSTALTLSFFTMLEVKDGYHRGFGFSWGDMVANVSGNILAQVLENSERVDEMFDFRLEYQPTPEFVDALIQNGVVDAAEDYSGQTFMFVYHLNSNALLTSDLALDFPRYFDLTLGFQAINFLPRLDDPSRPPKQRLFVGMAINLQQIVLEIFYPPRRDEIFAPPRRSTSYEAVEFITEHFTMPQTTIRIAEIERARQIRSY